MRARDVMSPVVLTVEASTPLRQVAAILSQHPGRAVVVVDEDGRWLGMVTERDLAAVLERWPDRPTSPPRAAPVHRLPVPRRRPLEPASRLRRLRPASGL